MAKVNVHFGFLRVFFPPVDAVNRAGKWDGGGGVEGEGSGDAAVWREAVADGDQRTEDRVIRAAVDCVVFEKQQPPHEPQQGSRRQPSR